VEVKEQYVVKISNRCAALENFDNDYVVITRARESITEKDTESLGYYELKQHKPWIDDQCSKLLDQRKQDKLEWLQNPSQTNGDKLNNERCETSKTFRKMREYLKEEIIDLESNCKNKYHRLI
jgi:hypothetical protein